VVAMPVTMPALKRCACEKERSRKKDARKKQNLFIIVLFLISTR
jgi:hypothetical protein